MNDSIAQIILFSINEIVERANWEPFEDLVLGLPEDRRGHPAQMEWLQKSRHRENGLHPGNGWGKTSVLAKKHLFFILKHFSDGPKYKTLNVSLTQDQAELVQDEMMYLVHHSPLLKDWLVSKTGSVKFPHARIRFANGAMTEFKTTKKKGESIEGKEYGYISADDIALEVHLEFIREKILLPRMRAWRDSQLDFSATPKGYTAFFRILEDIKRQGGYVRGGSSYENPHIDHTLLDYFCQMWSEAKINQIIHGKFVDTAGMMFASRVDKLFDSTLDFQPIRDARRYVEGWDLARGRKKNADQTVGFRLDVSDPQARLVRRWAFQLPWTEAERKNINVSAGYEKEHSSIEREIRTAHHESQAAVFLDSTGVGDTLYGMLQDIAEPVDFRGGRKDDLLEHLQACIDADIIKSPFIPELADEMTTYQRDDTLLDTDNLMALAIACSSLDVGTRKNIEPLPMNIFAEQFFTAPDGRRNGKNRFRRR